MTDNDHDILLEDINHKLDAILEGQGAAASVPGDISTMKSDIKDIKEDIKTVKAAIKGLSTDDKAQDDQLDDHELRITAIEQTA